MKERFLYLLVGLFCLVSCGDKEEPQDTPITKLSDLKGAWVDTENKDSVEGIIFTHSEDVVLYRSLHLLKNENVDGALRKMLGDDVEYSTDSVWRCNQPFEIYGCTEISNGVLKCKVGPNKDTITAIFSLDKQLLSFDFGGDKRTYKRWTGKNYEIWMDIEFPEIVFSPN